MSNVRYEFLNECCRKGTNVTVFTTNGFQLRGAILNFDGDIIIFRREDGRQAMVYQSAISTILAE